MKPSIAKKVIAVIFSLFIGIPMILFIAALLSPDANDGLLQVVRHQNAQQAATNEALARATATESSGAITGDNDPAQIVTPIEPQAIVRIIPPDFIPQPPIPVFAADNAQLWENWFIQVPIGTPMDALGLPSTIQVLFENDTQADIPILWSVTEMPWTARNDDLVFNPDIAGVFTFTGVFSDTENITTNAALFAPQMFIEVRSGVLHHYPRMMEWLDRAVVAVPVRGGGGNLVQWRLLAPEYQANLYFYVYRGDERLIITNQTNFIDTAGQPGDVYYIVPVGDTRDGVHAGFAAALPSNYFDIPVQKPRPRSNPANAFGGDGADISYTLNDMAVADVDGDGRYEILVKWTPSESQDPGLAARHTGETIFDLYTMDGALLWRINMGINIPSSAHHSIMHFFDLDNDGFAEFAIKTADGTRVYHPDPVTGLVRETFEGGQPVYIIGGDPSTNPLTNFDYNAIIDFSRNFFLLGEASSHPQNVWVGGTDCPVRGVRNRASTGRINNGPEFFTVFHGQTGLPIDTVEYFAPYGIMRNRWGDERQNRSDRFIGAVAMMPYRGISGARPHPTIIEGRQHYIVGFVAAYQLIDGRLMQLWTYDHRDVFPGGGGNHQLTVADVTFNGYDDVVFGSTALDFAGNILWSANTSRGTLMLGHGDALHMTPALPNSQEFYRMSPHEINSPTNVTVLHAATGRPVWTYGVSRSDVGRGVMANITPLPGFEVWASGTPVHNLYTGEQIHIVGGSVPINHMIYWTGQLTREFLDGANNQPLIISNLANFNFEYVPGNGLVLNDGARRPEAARNETQVLTGTLSSNGTKANPGLQVDILGDWREEILVRRADNQAIRVYITNFYTEYTIYTLMHDPTYRLAVNWQNVVYNQPPHLGFYLGPSVSQDVRDRNLPVPNLIFTNPQE